MQSGLAVGAVTALFALPLIRRQGSSGPGSALLRQNYVANLVVILGLIAAVTLGCYLVRVLRDRPSSTNERPPADHESSR